MTTAEAHPLDTNKGGKSHLPAQLGERVAHRRAHVSRMEPLGATTHPAGFPAQPHSSHSLPPFPPSQMPFLLQD